MKKYKFEINGYEHKWWYREGLRHREGDKPAVISANRNRFWYWKGLRHRGGDKPAVIWINGDREYWHNGRRVDKQSKME
jgi:hypothetical protein